MRIPAYGPASSFRRPSRVTTMRSGSEWVRHQYTSVTSPKVQHMTAPVPLSLSALSSAMTGTS